MFAQKLELVDDSEHEAEQDQVLEKIEAAIKKEEIRLPAMPDLVMKIRASFKDEQYDIIKIARIIQTEAGHGHTSGARSVWDPISDRGHPDFLDSQPSGNPVDHALMIVDEILVANEHALLRWK